MAMSGISVSPACDEAHERQLKKVKDIQWTMYRINPEEKGRKPEVVVDSVKERIFCANKAQADKLEEEDVIKTTNELWHEFVETLPESDGRYAVFDYVQKTVSGAFKDSIRFIAWVPEGMTVRKKMIYSSTKDTLKKKLNVPKEVFLCSKNADDLDDAFKEMMAN